MRGEANESLRAVNCLKNSTKKALQDTLSLKNDAYIVLKDVARTHNDSVARLGTTESTFDNEASIILAKLRQQQSDGALLLTKKTSTRDSFSNWEERFYEINGRCIELPYHLAG